MKHRCSIRFTYTKALKKTYDSLFQKAEPERDEMVGCGAHSLKPLRDREASAQLAGEKSQDEGRARE